MEQDSSIWDWGSLLDFTVDDSDPLLLPWDADEDLQQLLSLHPPHPAPPPPQPAEPEDSPAPAVSSAVGRSRVVRVRKRDPRLVCENFLAGRVPCACPEMDEMLREEEEEAEAEAEAAGGGRKRVKSAAAAATLRCQVPGCEVDIRELKGYHRRHRVCLRCANAVSVVIEGEEKRYCQQCGKFHLLSDFDEGKRSCRRKLEWHNRRRRRRPADFVSRVTNKRGQTDLSADAGSEEEPKEVNELATKKLDDRETLLESEDAHCSPICSLPSSQNIQSCSIMSSAVPSEGYVDEEREILTVLESDAANCSLPTSQIVQRSTSAVPAEAFVDEERETSKSASTICDNNRSTYSSVCPTGRVSFKLYDWNPAEFPRRLRHQIFQWLASMPVELEGYVRPGCTIFTIFIAMPRFMWERLSQDAVLFIKDLVSAPESLFLGRGNFFIFLNDMIFHVLKDGTSLVNVKMDVKAPRIHYAHPTYFEAGKPMEFVICGSNLDRPKFRFLVSFAGKYMDCDLFSVCHANVSSDGHSSHCPDHEMFGVRISQTDSTISGPAFVEVQNESGISNFITILIGKKHICEELERMQASLTGSLADSVSSQAAAYGVNPSMCELFLEKQIAMSQLVVDIAWLLKEPCPDESGSVFSSTSYQRLTCLLEFSIQNDLVNILELVSNCSNDIIDYVRSRDSSSVNPDADRKLLLESVNRAKEILSKRPRVEVRSEPHSGSPKQKDEIPHCYFTNAKSQDEERSGRCLCSALASTSLESDETIPLVDASLAERTQRYPQMLVNPPREPWASKLPFSVASTRFAVFLMVSVAMCFGACIFLLHPLKPGELAVSIRRGLFRDPDP